MRTVCSDVAGRPIAAAPTDDVGADEGLLKGMSGAKGPTHGSVAFALALPRELKASSLARQAVRERLAAAFPSLALDDVVLVVSELVTNAVTHGSGEIQLRIRVDGLDVTGEVSDQGGPFDPPIHASITASPGGLGLFIVAQLVESWGVHPGTARVWFQLSAPSVA